MYKSPVIRQKGGCLSEGKKCLFFGKFRLLCFHKTPVLGFTLLPYYRRSEPVPRTVYKCFAAQKQPQGDKWLRLSSGREDTTDSIHLFVSLKNYIKNVPIIYNDEEHTKKIVKIEFFHYNCLRAITKVIVGSHYMLLNPEQMLWSYW